MVQDASDTKALAKGQMGFIDLFCKPLFTAMSGCIDGELFHSKLYFTRSN